MSLWMLPICIIYTLFTDLSYSSTPNTVIKGKNLLQQYVPYSLHPYDVHVQNRQKQKYEANKATDTERRSLLTEAEVSAIRISAYYDQTTVINGLTSQNYSMVKQLIGAIAAYYSNAVKVVPISDTLFIERYCTNWYTTPFGNACYIYDGNVCGNMDIPSEHLAEQYLYDASTHTRTTLPGGLGIVNTDLMLYVSADDSTDSCTYNGAAAHAGPCYQDQYGRPIAGNINICSRFFSSVNWKQDVGTLLHEMTHITIMVDALWYDFRDSNGELIPVEQVYDVNADPKEIISSNVKQRVRAHFGCLTATGLQLDTYSNQHWHEKYAHGEIMNPGSYSQLSYYTQFTLALMEDSGWYLPNYEYAQPYAFGKDAGCVWFSGDCVSKTTHSSNFAKYFCDGISNNGCTADYMASGACYYYQWGSIPTEYQYFAAANEGGSYKSEYCPWIQPYTNGVCITEAASSTSRCTDVHRTDTGSDSGACRPHSCQGWDGSKYNSVDIEYNGIETVTCTRTEGAARTYKTLISASNRQLICPYIDNICGTNANFGACYYGHYSAVHGKCLCAPGYTATDCNTEDRNTDIGVVLADSEAPTSAPTTAPATVCFQDWDDYDSSFNGEWTHDTTAGNVGYWYGLGVYTNAADTRKIYFKGTTAEWRLSSGVGGSYYCMCNVSFYTADIADCNGFWHCYYGTMVLKPNLKTYYGSCSMPTVATFTNNPTLQPTPAPTHNPTLSPTKQPTPGSPTTSPTDFTDNPTHTPSDHPTLSPTNNPSKSPTDNPTRSPSNNPTLAPTLNPIQSPTDNPTLRPTDAPITHGSPTKAPTFRTDNPTKSPTNNPTDIPTPAPTNNPLSEGETINPSLHPTQNPVNGAVGSSTYTPTSSPSNILSNIPTYRAPDLHWICRYNGNLGNDLKKKQYANIMMNAIFNTLQLITGKSGYYDDGSGGNRAGVTNFKMCAIFSDMAVSLGSDCNTFNPLLIHDNDIEYEYFAIATFDVVADAFINKYKQSLIRTAESFDFKMLFSVEMNNGLTEQLEHRRRNLLTGGNGFEAVFIEIIDPYNITNVNTESSDTVIVGDDNTASMNILWILVIVIIVLGVIIIIGIILFKKCRNKANGRHNNVKKIMMTQIQLNTMAMDNKSVDSDNVTRVETNENAELKNNRLESPQMIKAINESWDEDEDEMDEIIDESLHIANDDDDGGINVMEIETGISMNIHY